MAAAQAHVFVFFQNLCKPVRLVKSFIHGRKACYKRRMMGKNQSCFVRIFCYFCLKPLGCLVSHSSGMTAWLAGVQHDRADRIIIEGITNVRFDIFLYRRFSRKHLKKEIAFVMIARHNIAGTGKLVYLFSYDLVALPGASVRKITCDDKVFWQFIFLETAEIGYGLV